MVTFLGNNLSLQPQNCNMKEVTCQINFQNFLTWECRNVGSHMRKERRQDTWGDFTSYNLESWNWGFLKIATLGFKCVFLDKISPNFNLKNMISIYTKGFTQGKKMAQILISQYFLLKTKFTSHVGWLVGWLVGD